MGTNYAEGFEWTELYIAHPDDLEVWFSRLEQRIRNDLADLEEILAAAVSARISPAKIQKFRSIGRRGVTVNNPHIPLSVVRENATPLPIRDGNKAAQQVRAFAKAHPLEGKPVLPSAIAP